MKKFIFVLSLLLVNACGINEENRRTVRLNLENGKEMILLIFEKKSYIGEERTLMVYANQQPLKDKYCDDQELKKFGDELFFEVIKRNDSPTIESGRIHLGMLQDPPGRPLYCIYSYAKKDSGEWTGEN